MPEMLKFETVRCGLEQLICGEKINRVNVLVPNMVKPSVLVFEKRITR